MATNGLQAARVLITGGTRGIGRACAEAFLRHGASVVLCGRDDAAVQTTVDELRADASGVYGVVCDVADPVAVAGFVEEAESLLGGIDVLVNNAGAYLISRFADLTDADWSRVLEVNLMGTVRCTRAVLPRMAAQGRVINIASTAGKYGSLYQSAYNASKHAVVGLTRCLALEYAATQIRVNAICPGFVETDMVADQVPTLAPLLDIPEEEVMDVLRARVPIGRFVTPEEVAGLAMYLASPLAAGMTGQALTLSGGMVLV